MENKKETIIELMKKKNIKIADMASVELEATCVDIIHLIYKILISECFTDEDRVLMMKKVFC
ncbi:MAG: hypothetical protein FWE22_03430 [Firmicutes bacterium]|nr:hypothetical protein [Bacillota bacterium]